MWLPKLDRRLRRMWIMKKYRTKFVNFITKVVFRLWIDAIYDVIIQEFVWKWHHYLTDMNSAGIHLLNQYSFKHTQPFSNKSTGLILLFVVLALCFCSKLNACTFLEVGFVVIFSHCRSAHCIGWIFIDWNSCFKI